MHLRIAVPTVRIHLPPAKSLANLTPDNGTDAEAPPRPDSLKSVVRTLNAIVNPEYTWRLEDQARRYHRTNENGQLTTRQRAREVRR
jgi:hypothetical protein